MTTRRGLTKLVSSWPYFLLLVLVIVFFWDSFLGNKFPLMRDTFFDFLPWLQFSAQTIREGQFPLWNHYSGLGKPFAADPSTAVFYPLHTLFVILPATLALKVSLALHLFIASASMYGLARHWKLDTQPAILSAISFAFGSWMIASLEFVDKLVTVVWTPCLLLVMSIWTERWGKNRTALCPLERFVSGFHLVALLGVLMALQYLGGNTQAYAYCLFLVFLFAVTRSVYARDFKMLLASVLAFAGAGFIAVLLTLPQFLLTLELIQHSERFLGIDPQLDMASLQLKHLLTLILPFLYGRPGYPDQYWAGTLFEFWLGTFYVGMMPTILLAFSAFSLWNSGSPARAKNLDFVGWFWVGILALGLVLSLGKHTPLYMLLYDYLPGFDRFRWPSKFLLWVVFSLAILCGKGYQSLLDRGSDKLFVWRRGMSVAAAWTLVLLLLGVFYLRAVASPRLSQWLTSGSLDITPVGLQQIKDDVFMALLFGSLGVILLVLYLFVSSFPRRWVHAGIIGLTFINLFVVAREIHFTAPHYLYEGRPELIKLVSSGPFPSRVYSVYEGLQEWFYGSIDLSSFAWAKEVSVGDTWLPFKAFHTWQGGMKLGVYKGIYSLVAELPAVEANRLLDLMNVCYVITGENTKRVLWSGAPKDIRLIKRPSCLPRTYMVYSWSTVSDWGQALRSLLSGSFNPLEEAIIEPVSSEQAAPKYQTEPSGASTGGENGSRVSSIQYQVNQVAIQVEARGKALLVLDDAWYPGWKVLVDGREKPIWRTNLLFRGVILDPGQHLVVFVYQPWQFRFGVGVSLGTGFLLLIFFCRRCLRFYRRSR